MKKITEILLIILTIGLSLSRVYFRKNNIEGIQYVFLAVQVALILLSIFYLWGLKNKFGIIVQFLLIIGLIGRLFWFEHFPCGFLMSSLNISMLLCAANCFSSEEVRKKINRDKYLLIIIGICLTIFSLLTISIHSSFYYIGTLFNFTIAISIFIYFIIRKEKNLSFKNNLKTFLMFSLTN